MPPRRATGASRPDVKGKGKAVDPPLPSIPTTVAATNATAGSALPTQGTTHPAPACESLFFDGGDEPSSSDEFPLENPRNDDFDNAAALSDTSDSNLDPVIKTYDIYFTTALTPHLHLFQYPVRSSSLPYSHMTGDSPTSARMKPQSGVVELDIPINTRRNYDQEKGRRWGEALRKARLEREARISGSSGTSRVGVGGKRRKIASYDNDYDDDEEEEEDDDIIHVSFEEAKRNGRVLMHQTLAAKLQPDNTRYMVGVFRNSQLHLTPINGTLQLRPQFNHIHTANNLEKELQKSLRIDPHNSSENLNPPAPAARSLQATVKRSIEEGLGAGEGALKVLRKEEGEEWVPLRWVDQDEEAAWEVFDGMFLPGTTSSPLPIVEPQKAEMGSSGGGQDVDMDGMGVEGKKCKENETVIGLAKEKSQVIRLKNIISGAEYRQLLAAPRVDRE